MSKDPAILFYTSDFLTGTAFLSFEQTGMYIKLLCHQHQLGHMELEDMINICGKTDKKVLVKFFVFYHVLLCSSLYLAIIC